MKTLSIRFKIPLIFSLISVLIFFVSFGFLSIVSRSQADNGNIRLLAKFAVQNSYDVLLHNEHLLTQRIAEWTDKEQYIRSLFFVDQDLDLIAPRLSKASKIVWSANYKKAVSSHIHPKYKHVMWRLNSKEDICTIPIVIANKPIGYLVAILESHDRFASFLTDHHEINLLFLIIVVIGGLTIVYTSFFLSRRVVAPVVEIIDYINKYTHSNPLHIKPIPLKGFTPCWRMKKCTDKSCKYYGCESANCWEKYFNIQTLSKRNPMTFPCFDCVVFTSRGQDEVEKLKIFLNQLISSIQFHYQRSKVYSSSLEEMINERTSELQVRSKELQLETTKSLLIIDNIIEGTLVTDLEGSIIQVNNNAKKLLNIKVDTDHHHDIAHCITDKEIATTLLAIIEEMKSDKHIVIKEVSLKTNGLDQFLLIKATYVQEKKTNFDMIVYLIEDITNTKLLDQFKNEFFNTISHDLKNPLTSIVGFLDLVLHGPDHESLSERHRKLLGFALRSSEDLQRMIMDLSDLVRLQTNKITLNKIIFPVKDFFCELENTFYPNLIEANTKITYLVEPDALLITADYYRLKQVFSNLVGNAIKSGRGITISLTACEKDTQIILAVSDTGAGIPAEKLPFIFEKFTRLYTYQDKSEGLGLGLSIVKTLVTLHNGTISVESVVGKGTTFTIALPKS